MSDTGAVGASYGDLLITSLLVLGGVIVAAFLVVRVVGRLVGTGSLAGHRMSRFDVMGVIARLSLEPRRSLYVVEVAGKTLLVGTSEMGLSVLSELDGAQVRAQVAARPSFGELVRGALLRRRGVQARGSAERAAAGPEPGVQEAAAPEEDDAEAPAVDGSPVAAVAASRPAGAPAGSRGSREPGALRASREPGALREPDALRASREPGELPASSASHAAPEFPESPKDVS